MDHHEWIVAALSGFVTEARRRRIEEALTWRTRYVAVLLEDIYQSQNASAVLRTCECLGVQDVHVVEHYNPYRINPMVVKGSDRWLSIRKYNRSEHPAREAVAYLKSEGYRIIVASPDETATSLHAFDLKAGKCVVAFGNEHQGVSEDMLREADERLNIPMCGFTQSLNVSVSAGIVLSQLLHRLRTSDADWRLSDGEKQELRAEWLKCSVKKPELILDRATGKSARAAHDGAGN
ncbi:MAG: RNA methyltransferase [Bacteroidales bacterium]|jgi:tRNA (guanosine-2'-O-)-methyltransferase|nr:RNA methyltransferase [Bacteroidales bacterium]